MEENQVAKSLTCPTKYSYLGQKVNCLWLAVSGRWVVGGSWCGGKSCRTV